MAKAPSKELQGKRVTITGGAGFVGSHLAEAIIDYVDCLVILDNMSTGRIENIDALLRRHPNKAILVSGDVRNEADCSRATRDADIVYHLAAQINPAKAVQDPINDFEVNARGSLNVLEAARRNNVTKLVYASTNIYGNPKYLPIDENHPMDLLSPYAASKVAGEAYAIVYGNAYGMRTVRLRFSNIYGPRQTTRSESGAVAIFIERVLGGKNPVIFGDGEQTRDFVYVTDVVNALVKASVTPKAEGEAFNIGFGIETTINQLAHMILDIASRLTGRTFRIKPLSGPIRSADFRRAQMNIAKAKEILGYRPLVMLQDGLVHTTRWYIEHSTR